MLQLLGHYSRIPCDSETVRHLHKVHNLQSCTLANVQHHAQQVGWSPAPSCATFGVALCAELSFILVVPFFKLDENVCE